LTFNHHNQIVLSLKRILDTVPMSRRHWFIWWIAAVGILVDGYGMFATAVTIPLLKRTLILTMPKLDSQAHHESSARC